MPLPMAEKRVRESKAYLRRALARKYAGQHPGERVRCVSVWESETHTAALFALEGFGWSYRTATAFKGNSGGYLTGPADVPITAMYAHEHVTALKRRGFRKVA